MMTHSRIGVRVDQPSLRIAPLPLAMIKSPVHFSD